MQARKAIALLSVVLFFAIPIHNVIASSTMTESFRGNGITVDVTFPEEAHPLDNITHDVTITANVNLTSVNVAILIYAQVGSTMQLVKNQPLSWGELLENQSLPTSKIPFQVPQQADGLLYCFMNVSTSQSLEYSSYSFYTTRVSNLTFTEMQNLYNEMLANYSALKVDYGDLLNQYNSLLANYSGLLANYTALLSNSTSLQAKYDAQLVTYQSLLNSNNNLANEYNTLNNDLQSKTNQYNTLQSDYKTLNSTMNAIQTTRNELQDAYNALNQTYTTLQEQFASLQEKVDPLQTSVDIDRVFMVIFVAVVAGLIAFIIYIRQRSKEPYVVIRKETIGVKTDE
jgi:predicted nuclease with TOPRIM domain